MATDAETLLSEGRCYQGCAGVSAADALELQLLSQISLLLNPDMATDANSLLYQARCLGCASGATVAEQMKLALLAQIVTGITITSTQMVFEGAADPNGVQTAPVGAIYNQIVGGVPVTQWIKASGSGNTGWV